MVLRPGGLVSGICKQLEGGGYLFIINSPSRLAPLLRCDPQHLILVNRELALLAPRRPTPVLNLRTALPPLRVQAGLGELEFLHGAALLLETSPGLVLLGLALLLLPRPVQPFDLLFLGEDVAEGAFAAKDVAVDAGYRVDGGLEAEAARAKREEGLARETRRAAAPGLAGERALVGCEDGTAGVSFACDVRGVLGMGGEGGAYCATFWRWCCVGDGVWVSSMSGNGIDTDTSRPSQSFQVEHQLELLWGAVGSDVVGCFCSWQRSLASSIQRPLSLVQHLPFRGFSTAFHSHPLLHIFRWQKGYAVQG